MPIYFKELEKIIIKWIQMSNIKRPKNKIGLIIYDSIMENLTEKIIDEINKLFNSISINNIEIIKNDTFPFKEKQIKINLYSKL